MALQPNQPGDPAAGGAVGSAATPQYPSWITSILTGIGAPINPTTVDNLAAWHQCELTSGEPSGGNNGLNNPFDTTLRTPGSTLIGGGGPAAAAGVQGYPSPAAGIAATVSTLLEGYYVNIVAALRSSAPRSTFAAAVGNSPWGSAASCINQAPGLRGPTSYMGSGSPTGSPGATLASSPGSSTGTGSSSAAGSACSAKGNVFSYGGVAGVGSFNFTYCQAKAITGGLILIGGAVLTLAGLVILARGPLQKAAGPLAAAAGPVGALKVAKAAAPAAAPAAAAAPARSEAGLSRARTVPAGPSRSLAGPGRRPPARARSTNRQVQKEGTEAYDAGYQKGLVDAEARARNLEVAF